MATKKPLTKKGPHPVEKKDDMLAKMRQNYIVSYAKAALQSGRLPLEEAVQEGRISWARQQEAEEQVTEILETLDRIDADDTKKKEPRA